MTSCYKPLIKVILLLGVVSSPLSASYTTGSTASNELLKDKSKQQFAPLDHDSVTVDREFLLANPDLLLRALEGSIGLLNIEAIAKLLPLYLELPQQQPIIVAISQAILAQYIEHDYATALAKYQWVLDQIPDLYSVRLLMATTQYQSDLIVSAQKNLKLLPQKLPEGMLQWAAGLNSQIEKLKKWNFSINLSPKLVKNINRAPLVSEVKLDNGATLRFNDPIDVKGIEVYLSASQYYPLFDKVYLNNKASLNWSIYSDKNYNDQIVNLSSGLVWNRKHKNFAISGLANIRFFSNKIYSYGYGIQLEFNNRLTERLTNNNSLTYLISNYQTRKHLDGYKVTLLSNLNYIVNDWYLSAGLDFSNNRVKDLSDSYNGKGLKLTISKNWQQALDLSYQLSFQQRNYLGPDIFNIMLETKQISNQFTLSLRSLNWYGMTPRLVFNYSRVLANHYLHRSYDRTVNLELMKSF